MQHCRTPDEQFENLPDYEFSPNYVMLNDFEGGELRMHYLDEGNGDAEPILLLHGEPSWSYLYRKMIPVLVGAGHRVVAPDLIGFGRSDKPLDREDYTYERHVGWLKQLIDKLLLENITLFAQDWGGLTGLRLAAENERRFARIAIGNTALPTGDYPLGEAFDNWKHFSQTDPAFDIGGIIVNLGGIENMSEAEIAAYNAPFPEERYKAGARQFPTLVPDSPDNPAYDANHAAWKVLERWEKPFLTAFSDGDPTIAAGVHLDFQKRVPGAKGQSHIVLRGAGHFLQEQVGPELAGLINQFIADNSSN